MYKILEEEEEEEEEEEDDDDKITVYEMIDNNQIHW